MNMKTKGVYVVSILLLIIIVASIVFYIFYNKNSKTVFDGTLVRSNIEYIDGDI